MPSALCPDSGDHYLSPMGDQRPQAVPCFWCGWDRTGRARGRTRNWGGVCDAHLAIEADAKAGTFRAPRQPVARR